MTQDLEFLKSSYEENNAFVKNNLSLFGEIDQRFRFVAPKNRLENADRLRESWLKGRDKRAYIAKISDQKVGYFYGEQQDASSFYMRVSVIDKKFRGQGIYSRFLDFFLSELKEAGY